MNAEASERSAYRAAWKRAGVLVVFGVYFRISEAEGVASLNLASATFAMMMGCVCWGVAIAQFLLAMRLERGIAELSAKGKPVTDGSCPDCRCVMSRHRLTASGYLCRNCAFTTSEGNYCFGAARGR